MPQPTVALLGALDTKAAEYAFVSDRLRERGCAVLLIDTGVLGTPGTPVDIDRRAVAEAGGADLASLRAAADRDAGMRAMAAGAARLLADLHRQDRVHGVLALGGSNAAFVTTQAVAGLPVGFPKLLVSTMAAGDTRAYVGETDLTLMYPVVDVNGLNRLSRRVLANAAGAIAGMATTAMLPEPENQAPVVALSMFGVTTAAGARVQRILEAAGRETLTFHATGVGGRTLEHLVRQGLVAAVADLTTTELADDLVGGVCSAGPERLTAAAECDVPQVVSVGALDMVNFGAPETVPDRFAGRLFHHHNPHVTLMRTNAEECAELGHRIAVRLNKSTAPVVVLLPTGGLSQISAPGQPFHDPEADAALLDTLSAGLERRVQVRRFAGDVNDPELADAAACLITHWTEGHPHG